MPKVTFGGTKRHPIITRYSRYAVAIAKHILMGIRPAGKWWGGSSDFLHCNFSVMPMEGRVELEGVFTCFDRDIFYHFAKNG